jgi:hypothetical protein
VYRNPAPTDCFFTIETGDRGRTTGAAEDMTKERRSEEVGRRHETRREGNEQSRGRMRRTRSKRRGYVRQAYRLVNDRAAHELCITMLGGRRTLPLDAERDRRREGIRTREADESNRTEWGDESIDTTRYDTVQGVETKCQRDPFVSVCVCICNEISLCCRYEHTK